ncbi:response regulator, partial [Desulfobacterales bacterium HSG2]|nr:response regulator [Desulfobacterales bacterium HSG2]
KNDENLQTVLIFKYGRKERFAMALPLIRRIERIFASDIEHVGDKEFVTINDISTRVLRLDQVLDVSPGVGKDGMFLILPRYIKRPVGLLASGLVDIEETNVELNVESYMEDGLLGTFVIQDRMTLFIDIYRLIEKIEPEWFADRRMNSFGTPGPPDKDAISDASAKRVLLVEDASFFRHLIKGYLEADGYDVITAEHGKAGLERMNENQFDLIVSDIEMPVMDGWDFVKSVRGGTRQNNIPTVALTALDSDRDRAKAKRCGYDRYEVKIDRERFLTTVAEILGEERD